MGDEYLVFPGIHCVCQQQLVTEMNYLVYPILRNVKSPEISQNITFRKLLNIP